MTRQAFDGVGTDSALRRELEKIMDEQERRGKGIPFYMPVKEIVSAAHAAFADVPRIPDYDDELARERVFCTDADPVDRGELPTYDEVQVRSEDGYVTVTISTDGEPIELIFDPEAAQGLFLAGLSATAQARKDRAHD